MYLIRLLQWHVTPWKTIIALSFQRSSFYRSATSTSKITPAYAYGIMVLLMDINHDISQYVKKVT